MKQRLKQVLHPGERGKAERQILAYRLGPSYPPAQKARLRRWKLQVCKRTLLEDGGSQPAGVRLTTLYVPCELWCPPSPHVVFTKLAAPHHSSGLADLSHSKVSAALPVLQLAQNWPLRGRYHTAMDNGVQNRRMILLLRGDPKRMSSVCSD